MTNSILEKKWMRWYPKKIFLKNIKKNKKKLYNSDQLKEEDFSIHETENEGNNKTLGIDIKIKEESKIEFEKGFLEGKKESLLLEEKLKSLFSNFESSFSLFEDSLYARLLKIVLKISSYVIGKNIDIDESILLKSLKKIIEKDGVFLRKPQLIVHPNNKVLIQKILKDFLNNHSWTIIYDDNIDVNGCKIKSESLDINSTINARWEELCRLIDLEEDH